MKHIARQRVKRRFIDFRKIRSRNLRFLSDPNAGLFFMKANYSLALQITQSASRILRDIPVTNHVIDLLHEDTIYESIRARREDRADAVCVREVFEPTPSSHG